MLHEGDGLQLEEIETFLGPSPYLPLSITKFGRKCFQGEQGDCKNIERAINVAGLNGKIEELKAGESRATQ